VRARICRGSLVVLALLVLGGGCARALAPPREPVSEENRRAIALLVDRWHAFSDLRTLADIQLAKNGEKQRLTGVLLARAPASLRFEALSPFGQLLLVTTIADGRLTTYNVADNQASTAPATADTAARLLGLPFDPEDLVAVLAGLAVPPRDLRVADRLPADATGPSLEMIGADHRQRVWMDFTTGVVRKVEITGGRYAVTVAFVRTPDGRPAGFDLSAGDDYVTGSVRYRDPILDGGVDPERFRLALPAGVAVRPLR
jgi:outer membrane lipoprotein-sorting protein